MKTPRKILLDQYHIDIYIRPKRKLTTEDRQKIKRLMNSYLSMVVSSMEEGLENKILVAVSQ